MLNFLEIQNKINELKLCVIVPTYNNAGTINKVVTDVQQYTKNVIVVNDGSTDNTQQIISKIEGIEIVTYPKNKGKGYALQQGFKYAIIRVSILQLLLILTDSILPKIFQLSSRN